MTVLREGDEPGAIESLQVPPADRQPRQHHVAALDGLRGVAAIGVVFFHAGQIARHGYLAVDFFFLLSGYVIALAYEQKLREGLRWTSYMGLRILRFYPMILLGALVGAATAVIGLNPNLDPGAGAPLPLLARALAGCLFLIPLLVPPLNFALNVPFWSLLFEVLVNAAHAAVLPWLSRQRLLMIVVVAALGLLAIAALRQTIDGGLGGRGTLIAVPRVVFGFGFGIYLFRTREQWLSRIPQMHFIVPLLAMIAIQFLPHGQSPRTVALVDWLLVVAVMPLVMMIGARAYGWRSLTRELGLLSYPLYAIHFPLLNAFPLYFGARADSIEWRLLAIAAVVLVAWAAARYIDRPVMRWRQEMARRRLADDQHVATA